METGAPDDPWLELPQRAGPARRGLAGTRSAGPPRRAGSERRWLAVAAVVASDSPAPPAWRRAQISARGWTVCAIDVLVTENGRPVTALSAADFEVRDNGVPQTIDLVSLSDVGVSVVLALDLSASVDGPRLPVLRRAGYTLIDALTARDAAALVTFNRAAVLRVPLTDGPRSCSRRTRRGDGTTATPLSSTPRRPPCSWERPTAAATSSWYSATASIPRATRRQPWSSRRPAVPTAWSTPCPTSDDATPFLRDVSSATGGRVIEVDQDDDPDRPFSRCCASSAGAMSSPTRRAAWQAGGWHRLDVRVARGNARVRTRPGYFSAAP